MINKGIFKEAYELAVAYRYNKVFVTANKNNRDRLIVIRSIIMDKSPAYTKSYKDFYRHDLLSFNHFHEDLIEIKKRLKEKSLEDKFYSHTGWYNTWSFIANRLPGLDGARHNIENGIYRDNDIDLIILTIDWYIDNEKKNRKLFEEVYKKDELNKYIIKMIFERWDKIRIFTK